VCIVIDRRGVHIPVYRARALWAIACQVIHEQTQPVLSTRREKEREWTIEIADTCFQVRCKRNQQAQRVYQVE
jgi:hypothetical protein